MFLGGTDEGMDEAFADQVTELVLTAFAEAFAVATTAPDCELLIGVYAETYDPDTYYPETYIPETPPSYMV